MPKFIWDQQPWEIQDEVADEHGLDWDPIEELSMMSDFVKENCDAVAFRIFVINAAQREVRMSEERPESPPDIFPGHGVDGWGEFNG